MFYMLPTKTASFEGEAMGEKEFVYSAKRKEVEAALKEALELLAEQYEIIEAVAHIGVDFGYGKFEIGQDEIDKARLLIEPNT